MELKNVSLSDIRNVFVNTLNPDNKYSLRISENGKQLKCNYLTNKKFFLDFLLHL